MNESNRQKNRSIHICMLFILAGLLVCLSILAWVPPISRDALIHHLQIPKLYLHHGGFYEIPDLIFSYYPMNLDLLYMGALYLGNDILPKYIHMAFGLATAFLLYGYLKCRLPLTYAYLGPLFFLSIPIIIKLSITVYVDLGLVFFTTAALLLLFEWLNKGYRAKHLILAGICCGLAVGTKYNGLVIVFLLSLFIPVLYIRNTNKTVTGRAAVRASILFVLCALLAASPWLIRNSIWTGNPIYPLYDSVFNPSNNSATNTTNSIQGVFSVRHVLYGEDIWQLLLLPVRIFFQGVDNDPRYFDGRLNPFLLILPLFAFLYQAKQEKQIRMEKTTLLIFCILYFLFAFNTSALRIRYLTPMIPFLVILAMYGLHNIQILTKQYIANRNIVLSIWLLPICLMFALNGTYLLNQFQTITPSRYISGQLTRDEYLIQFLPETKVMQYANTHLPASAKILCIFMGWRGYYLNNEHSFDHHSNSEWLLAWLKESDITTNQILQRLKQRRISHLLIREDLFNQWWQQASPRQQSLWAILMTNHLITLHSHLSYTLYQVAFDERSTLLSPHHDDTLRRIQ